jgi:hypothetical protein
MYQGFSSSHGKHMVTALGHFARVVGNDSHSWSYLSLCGDNRINNSDVATTESTATIHYHPQLIIFIDMAPTHSAYLASDLLPKERQISGFLYATDS